MSRWLQANKASVLRWGGIAGGHVLVQFLVQLLNGLAGFLLLRTLDKPNYAWFTITSAVAASLSILGDAGIGSAVTSIGGGLWQDKKALSNLIRAALQWRLKMGLLASAVVVPFSIWLLHRNGASVAVSATLTLLVLAPVWHISTAGVLNVVNRLRSKTLLLQIAELVPAALRACLTLILVLTDLITPVTALLAVLVSQLCQYWIVARQVAPYINEPRDEAVMAVFAKSVRRIIRQYFPNCAFISVQVQLATWIISLFATTTEVADLGALNRFSIIFAILGAPIVQFLGPAFARTQHPERLRWMAGLLIVGYSLFCICLLGAAYLKGEWFLWVLGAKYQNLRVELVLVLAGTALANMNVAVWTLNSARGWVSYAWLNIPLTITTQMAATVLVPLNTVRGLALFTIITCAVQLCHASFACWHGLSSFHRLSRDEVPV